MSEMIEREVPLLGPDGRLDASQLPASVEQRLAVSFNRLPRSQNQD